MVLFADDAAFFITATSVKELYFKINKLFEQLSRYLDNNKLIPNLNKSKLMYFNSRPFPSEGLEDLYFREIAIEWVSDYKYLGLTLSNKMSFAPHIDLVSGRLSRFTGIFHHLRKIVPLSVLRTLYHSFILPYITLHIEVWGSAPEVYIHGLSVKQNKLLRAILGTPVVNGRPIGHVIDMYRNLNILTVNNVYRLHLFKFLMFVLKQSSMFYNLLLRPLEITHTYRMRNSTYRQPMITCEVDRRGITNQMVQMHTQIDITEFSSLQLKLAVRKYKKQLLNSQ